MARNLFSVPIFFIVFRETLEAAIIVSVLLGLAEQIVSEDKNTPAPSTVTISSDQHSDEVKEPEGLPAGEVIVDDEAHRKLLIKRMRIQIFLGAGIGLFIALAIGAAFIAVWFTQASDLWDQSEELWEGIFELIAAVMIFVMGVSMLKLDRAKAKWRIKLERAFSKSRIKDRKAGAGKWVLFILPLITVLREGLEAVVFVGGVSLGQSATSIPIAAIVGLICGLVCGFLIYQFASRSTLTVFLIIITNFLLLIGAGLFSRAAWSFQEHAWIRLLGANNDDSLGDGPGSYRVQGNVWHLDCCDPENDTQSAGWGVFNALLGWTNSATLGSVLSYVFYWIAVIVVLVYLKFTEGRTTLLGRESAMGAKRRIRREKEAFAHEQGEEQEKVGGGEGAGAGQGGGEEKEVQEVAVLSR